MHATSNQALGRQTAGFGVVVTGLAIAASVAVGAVLGINLASKAGPLAGATYSLITPSSAVDLPEAAIAAAKAPFVPKDESVAPQPGPNVVAPAGPSDRYWSNTIPGPYTGPGYDDQSYLVVPGSTYLDGAEARHSGAMRTQPHRPALDFSGVKRAALD